jgi:hypothetical protein
MLFRLKCYLLSLLALAAAVVFVYETAVPSMLWLGDRFPDQLAWQLAGMFVWLMAANLVFLGPVWLLKCPECRHHFGLRNYLVDGWLHIVPPRFCPSCGADMYGKGEVHSAQDRTGVRAA